MNDILQKIVEETKRGLPAKRPYESQLRSAAEARRKDRTAHRFAAALQGGRNARGNEPARIIAETKSASPSAGAIVLNPQVERIVASYERGGAAALSVVTEPKFFRGDLKWLGRAAHAAPLPVIMKDFVLEPVQMFQGVASGADAVLLLAALLDAARLRDFIALLHELGVDALVEVHDEAEADRAIEAGAGMIGVNNRNLRDFSVTLKTSESIAAILPENVVRISESGIRERADVERLLAAGFDAFLVGESLLRQDDLEAAVRRLAFATPPKESV